MFSYAFPPVAASGTFRVARFVRYLPDFGWRPIVVAPKPKHAIHNNIDPSLQQLIPAHTIVAHTSVLRPSVWTKQWLSKLFCGRRGPAEAPENRKAPEAKAPHGTTGDAAQRHWRRAAQDGRKFLFETPDRHVGWVLPALCAGLRLVGQHRPRAIYSTGPPHSAHLAAILLKSITGIPVVCDFRDPWARNPWWTDEGKLQSAGQRWMESLCVRGADAIVLNTEAARVEFESNYRGRKHGTFESIPNGYDLELLPRIAELRGKQVRAATNGSIRLCHCGSVYGNRDLMPLIEAVAKLATSKRHVELCQVGGVGKLSELHDYVRRHALEERVEIRGQLSHEQALASMAEADLLVVLQGGTQLQIPAKVFEMMHFAKPILALTDEGPTADIVRYYGLGVVADPSNPEAIARAIAEMSDRAHEFVEDSPRAEAVEAFDGRKLTGKLADLFGECARKD